MKIDLQYLTVLNNGDWEWSGVKCNKCGATHMVQIEKPVIVDYKVTMPENDAVDIKYL